MNARFGLFILVVLGLTAAVGAGVLFVMTAAAAAPRRERTFPTAGGTPAALNDGAEAVPQRERISEAVHDERIGRQVEDFTLDDPAGRPHSLGDFRDGRIFVVAFLGTECPLAQAYGRRLSELDAQYRARNVVFLGIFSNQQDTLAEIAAYGKLHGIEFALLRDTGNVVADRLGARRTPEIYVLDHQRKIRYHGRVDDQFGIHRGTNYQKRFDIRHDLVAALDDLLASRRVRVPATQPLGCLIGRLRPAEEGSPVTWSKQIVRIFQQHCQHCHRPGEVGPFSLLTYQDAVGWAAMVEEVVRQERMPPWGASPEHGDFINDPRLTAEEKEQIYTWVARGAPEGDPADLPPPRTFRDGWRMQDPDLVLYIQPEPFPIPAKGTLEYQYFTLDPRCQEDRWLIGVEARPDCKAVIHHMGVFIKTDDGLQEGQRFQAADEIAGYVPGIYYSDLESHEPLAPGAAEAAIGAYRLLPANAKLVVEMHYTSNGTAQLDHSAVALKFAKQPPVPAAAPRLTDNATGSPTLAAGQTRLAVDVPSGYGTSEQWARYFSEGPQQVSTRRVESTRFAIPPGKDDHLVEAWETIDDDILVAYLHGHMHWRGKAFRFIAHYPDGRQETLLDVPRYDFDWQHMYIFRRPKLLPRGTRLQCLAWYDNSAQNLRNPDPTIPVTYGEQTWHEMMAGTYEAIRPLRMELDGDAKSSTAAVASADLLSGYTDVRQVAPEHQATYYYQRGLHREARGDRAGGIADYSQALAIDPRLAAARMSRAAAFAAGNDHEKALADYDRLLERDGDHKDALLARGQLHLRRGETENAFLDYTRAIELEPHDPEPQLSRAEIWNLVGDRDEAIAECSRILRDVHPRFEKALLGRGLMRLALGEMELAEKDFDDAIRLMPFQKPRIRFQIGNAYLQHGEFDRAVEYFRAVLEALPGSPKVLHALAVAYIRMERWDDARASCDELVQAENSSADALNLVGRLCLHDKELAKAVTHYRGALERDPRHVGSLNDLAWLLATSDVDEIRNPQEALALALEACRLSQYQIATCLDTLAAAHASVGQFENAAEVAQRAAELAAAGGRAEEINNIRNRMELYRNRQPFRQRL